MRSTLRAVPVLDSCPPFRRERIIPKKYADLLITQTIPTAASIDKKARTGFPNKHPGFQTSQTRNCRDLLHPPKHIKAIQTTQIQLVRFWAEDDVAESATSSFSPETRSVDLFVPTSFDSSSAGGNGAGALLAA